MVPALLWLATSKIGRYLLVAVLAAGVVLGAYAKGNLNGRAVEKEKCRIAFASAVAAQMKANQKVQESYDRQVTAYAEAGKQAEAEASAELEAQQARSEALNIYLKHLYSRPVESRCSIEESDLKADQ